MQRAYVVFLFVLILVCHSCRKSFNDYPTHSQVGYFSTAFSEAPFYYHFAPNSFIKDGKSRKAIASESIEDVELAARLGFRFIEANIWETSDGHYICIHGSDGRFGPEVKSVDSSVISTEDLRETRISSVSLDWVKANIRYDSDYEKYQTTIPSLEEFCIACKQNGIGILAGVAGKRKAVEICIKYLADNIVVYSPPDDIRDYFKGYVFTWNNKQDVSIESLLKNANRYGPPYICSLGGTAIRELETRKELDDLIEEMHKNNYLVGWASVYSGETDSMRYLRAGMDFSGSGHEVNHFEANYDYFDLDDIYHLPSTTGVISDGILSLSTHDTITCGTSSVISVGKGALSIKFKGAIRISFGSLRDSGDRYELTSEGDELFVFSDFFFHCPTTLTIESLTDNTTVSHLVYKTAIC